MSDSPSHCETRDKTHEFTTILLWGKQFLMSLGGDKSQVYLFFRGGDV